MVPHAIALGLAYVLGALPFGYVIVRVASGKDVRGGGSGSTGATNVTRTAGLKAGALTYLLDVTKGIAAVACMLWVTGEPLWLGLAAAAAILGHIFPVFLGFKGGKGVATGVGAYLVMAPLAVLSTLAVWALIFWRSRMVSLASIVATALVPVWVLLWYGLVWPRPGAWQTALATCIGCVVVIAKHRQNIRRLLEGTENRFSSTSKSES